MREEAEAREAQLRRAAAEEMGLSLLKADAGVADPATLMKIISAVVQLGSEAALARLNGQGVG